MRLSFLAILLLVASVPASSAEPQAAGNMPVVDPRWSGPNPVITPGGKNSLGCPITSRYEAMKRGKKPGRQLLNELPGADHYKAVYRIIDGCEVPIMADFSPSSAGASPKR